MAATDVDSLEKRRATLAAQGWAEPSEGGKDGGDQAHEEKQKEQSPEEKRRGRRRRWLVLGGVAIVLVAAGIIWGIPWLTHWLNTVSTDDAYVNGHSTAAAARVPGQVVRVLVEDNNRVRKGDVLLELDPEPYRIQVALRQAGVETAQASLANVRAQTRALVGQTQSQNWRLRHSIDQVRNQIALLHSNVAQLKVEQANLKLAENDFARAKDLIVHSAISQQQFDQYKAALEVQKNRVASAEDLIQQTRASLGLSEDREHPLDVPPRLDETYSGVRQGVAELLQGMAQLGIVPKSYNVAPGALIAELDSLAGNEQNFSKLVDDAPSVRTASAELQQATDQLRQAELNLSYCRVVAEIEGVVSRRHVNPGDNVQVGQALMNIRSLSEIWIDANFKETQLADIRIGQRAELRVDMYGKRRTFAGRVTGFTAATGSAMSLLPAQNATGNFVKVVQRLPVRIELTEPNPENSPLFVGLSVVPEVYIHEQPTGPDAGKYLQPYLSTVSPSQPAQYSQDASP